MVDFIFLVVEATTIGTLWEDNDKTKYSEEGMASTQRGK